MRSTLVFSFGVDLFLLVLERNSVPAHIALEIGMRTYDVNHLIHNYHCQTLFKIGIQAFMGAQVILFFVFVRIVFYRTLNEAKQ
jgi:hypothetical protein